MASTTYFGRPADDGRRLGADLDLLAKWSRTFSLRAPVHSYHLSQLSGDDQAMLFSGPAREFRFREGPNNTVKLETVEHGVGSKPPGQVELGNIDPDVIAMMRSDNYIRSEARIYELLCEIEDAQEESEAIAAREITKAIRQGMDSEAAAKIAQKAASNVLLVAGRRMMNRQKAERLEQLTKDIYFAHADSKTATTETFDCRTDRHHTTPMHPPQSALKHASPHESTPGYGSETTAGSAHSSSPRYSTADTLSSPELESVDGFLDDSDGGAALLPSVLVEELGFKNEATLETPTPAARFGRLHGKSQISGVHLGAGLTQAAVARLAGTDDVFTASASSVCSGGQFLNSIHVQNTTADKSPPPFSPEKKTREYPLAKEQPWTGFTCFDVPSRTGKDQLVPEYWTTKRGKERYVRHKIGDLKLHDARLRSDRVAGSVARNPIHIFIDLSNIIIGFYDCMKERRGIPVQKRVRAPAFSFKNFDTILTRDRNVAKRIVAGSVSANGKRWPDYMVQAQELKYEMNILQRVPKPASPQRKRKPTHGSRELEPAAFGAYNSGDDCFVGPLKQGEQGVDELLHLKILQSAMDTPNPATMVLATGDAADAEYSDGFKKNIERVLALGWNIELYGWSRNISSAWREPEFVKQWENQFKIIELDQFCEELFDMTIESLEQ
ncbi:hypothetical protein VTK56DRAFT_5565 [Thermocarpiscus australiensis]